MSKGAWMDGVGSGGDWKLYLLPWIIGAGIWAWLHFSGKKGQRERDEARRKYEEYLRLYEAGQREFTDLDHLKFNETRKHVEEMQRRSDEAHRRDEELRRSIRELVNRKD